MFAAKGHLLAEARCRRVLATGQEGKFKLPCPAQLYAGVQTCNSSRHSLCRDRLSAQTAAQSSDSQSTTPRLRRRRLTGDSTNSGTPDSAEDVVSVQQSDMQQTKSEQQQPIMQTDSARRRSSRIEREVYSDRYSSRGPRSFGQRSSRSDDERDVESSSSGMLGQQAHRRSQREGDADIDSRSSRGTMSSEPRSSRRESGDYRDSSSTDFRAERFAGQRSHQREGVRQRLFDSSQLEPAPQKQPTPPVRLPVVRPPDTNASRADKGFASAFFSSSSWQEAGATDNVITALESLGVKRPSHVQAAAYKMLKSLAGPKHVAIADQAGSGKTLAYVLPLLQQLKKKEEKLGGIATKPNRPFLVVMTPTAELAQQVGRVIRAVSDAGLRVRSAVMTGGQSEADRRSKTFRTQCELLSDGVDVLVSTPGRLLAHLEKGSLLLDETAAIVMDEVDVLAGGEVSYQEHIAPLRAAAAPETRFVLVSATLPQHTFDQLQDLFPGLEVAFGPGLHRTATGCIEELVDCSGGDEISLESGTQRKLEALLESLNRVRSPRTIIFCNKIETCRVVENALKRQGGQNKFEVFPFHEAIREDLRASSLTTWLSPPTESELPKILVCTDRTSRGIDSMWCEHVVLFEFPRDPSEYVRRVGRTARGVGGKGVVTVLVLGKQVALANEIMSRNKAGAPVHRVPRVWSS